MQVFPSKKMNSTESININSAEWLQCMHLRPVQEYLMRLNIKETFRGQTWSINCRDWIYYDCVLAAESLIKRFDLQDCVEEHNYLNIKVGGEMGLYCKTCHDAVVGQHPHSPYAIGLKKVV